MSQIICGYLKLSERGGLNAAVFPAKRLDGPTIQKKTPASVPSFKHFNTGGHCAQQSAEWTVLSMANGHRVALFGIMAPWSEVVGSGRKWSKDFLSISSSSRFKCVPPKKTCAQART